MFKNILTIYDFKILLLNFIKIVSKNGIRLKIQYTNSATAL